MADEIIDLRDRIEKMRIEIENEGIEQVSVGSPLQIHKKTNNSNISLSMENKKSFPNQNFKVKNDSDNLDDIENKSNKSLSRNEAFPAVSLSVKNPVSSKVLTLLVTLQVLSNIGILYFLASAIKIPPFAVPSNFVIINPVNGIILLNSSIWFMMF